MKICNVFTLILPLAISFAHAKSSKYVIEQITPPHELSEGPHWDVANQVLYFVDIPKADLYCFHPKTKSLTHTHINATSVGVAVPVAGKKNTFLAGAGRELVEVSWDPSSDNLRNPSLRVLSNIERDRPYNRFNDGKVDPKGRFWAGTMEQHNGVIGSNKGALYRFAEDGTPTTILDSVSISNGLTWSPNNDTFYYIDSPTKEIVAYDYNEDTGDISNKRSIFHLTKHNIPGVPDGMTIDSAGKLWIAVFDGGRVLEVCPKTGNLIQTVEMPVKKITSAAFGGPNLDVLYVTSAKEGLSAEDLKQQPLAGSVFAVHGLGVTGSPMRSSRMN